MQILMRSRPTMDWLDAAKPNLWPRYSLSTKLSVLRQLLGDGEIDIAMAFNPADAFAAIARGELPDSVRTYIHDSGTLANVHFLAIPFNSAASEMVRKSWQTSGCRLKLKLKKLIAAFGVIQRCCQSPD